jgi:hypothetical protein
MEFDAQPCAQPDGPVRAAAGVTPARAAERCPPLVQTRIDPIASCRHPPHVDDRQLCLEAGFHCQFFAAPESLHGSRTKWRIENLNGALVYVSFAAIISSSRPAALGRQPVLAVCRWPAAMRLIPDFGTSMTAVRGAAATG